MRKGARGRGRDAGSAAAWARYALGRLLQVTGLLVTLVAATAFFGSSSITAMLKLMIAGVCLVLPGWLLARRDPRAERSP